jgi:hypothetical protein
MSGEEKPLPTVVPASTSTHSFPCEIPSQITRNITFGVCIGDLMVRV